MPERDGDDGGGPVLGFVLEERSDGVARGERHDDVDADPVGRPLRRGRPAQAP